MLDSHGSKCFTALYNNAGSSCDNSCANKLGWYGDSSSRIGPTVHGWFGDIIGDGDKHFQILERNDGSTVKTSGVDSGEKGCTICMCEAGEQRVGKI